MTKKIFANIAMVTLAVVCTLAAIEIGLRLSWHDDFNDLKKGREIIIQPSPHRDIKYELVPKAQGYAWGTDVTINSMGYRGRAGTPGRFNGFRALAIGDSITFGNGLPIESTYAWRLHDLLNTTSSAYEVLNFGVGGYDIIQNVALVQHKGLQYKPDLIILGYCHNDLGIVSLNSEYIERAEQYNANPIFNLRIVRFIVNKIERKKIGSWLQHQNRPEIFLENYKTKITAIGNDEHELRSMMQQCSPVYPIAWYRDENRLGRLRYGFEQLAESAQKNNFSVVVVIVPLLVGSTQQYLLKPTHAILQHEAKRVGFDVIEVVDEFLAFGIEKIKMNKSDSVHPNADGHRIIAKKLAHYIKNKWPEKQ